MSPTTSQADAAEDLATRPVLQALARIVATDRRPSVLANERGDILLANAPAQRLGLDQRNLNDHMDWKMLCVLALRAGSTPVSLSLDKEDLEGEVVHIPMTVGDGYLLRLAENDHEATWLRNRSRAATLMRVAHDLRTPIQSLLAIAESVLTAQDDESAQDRESARQQLRQTSELALEHISNVLSVIRGEQSVAGLRPDETFNVTEELRTLIMMISPIARKRDVALKLWLDPHDDTWVHGPVRFVRALFQNLIDNSAKYGGAEVEIGLICRPLPAQGTSGEQEKITLIVKDLGGGLPADQKARLLEALGKPDATSQQATDQPKRPSAGLNVLAHALRQLGATLEFHDRYHDVPDGAPATGQRPPIGTEFQVTMVLPKADQSAEFALGDAVAASTDGPLHDLSVILVEDSPASRDWLRNILTSAGARVWAAGNAIEALSLLARPEICAELDVILTDMTLPYMSGVEFAQRVLDPQSSGWTGPIVALTAHVADPILNACREARITTVLEKPIRPARLYEALLAAVDRPQDRSSAAPLAPRQDTAPQAAPAPARDPALDPAVDPAVGAEPPNPLKMDIVDELIAQLGQGGALGFMRRAHKEAGDVLSRLQNEGIGADTGRMLHAATGACSLTGLGALEICLRRMEQAFDNSEPLASYHGELEGALRETSEAIARLG